MRIAVVGGGASGSLTAIHLARQPRVSSIAIFDPTARWAKGNAYGMVEDGFLLNVRADRMSAFPDQPDHFARWAAAQAGIGPEDFAPRKAYGQYLQSILAANEERISFVPKQVDSIGAEGHIEAEGELQGSFDHVVLALGNRPPRLPRPLTPLRDHPQVVVNPWPGLRKKMKREAAILIIGTGLTMVDVVTSLASRGHKGPITAVSRRGLLPQPHASAVPAERNWSPETLFADVISACREAGTDWRSVIDGLRKETPSLWQALSERQKKQFLNRLQPFWDVHRHRMPPSAATTLYQLQEEGQLEIRRIQNLSLFSESPIEIVLDEETARPDWAINCTGPGPNFGQEGSPLLNRLVNEGLVRQDLLGIGLAADAYGRCSTHPPIWTLGPLRRGELLETTAMPEIRVQAEQIAARIAASE